jgi:outer membrane protein TolC
MYCALISVLVDSSSVVTAQDAPLPRPNPLGDAPLTAPNALPPSEPAVNLTLEDAKQRALSTSKGLGLAKLAIREKQEATAAARTDYLPKLLANDLYFHFNSNLGVVETLRTGRLGILPPVGTRTIAVRAVNQDANLFSLTLAQPITKLIAVNAAVKIARADEEIARSQLATGTQDLLSGVAQAFYGLNGAQRIEAVLRPQVDYLEPLSRTNPSPDVRVALEVIGAC